jgi:hypothetical protein
MIESTSARVEPTLTTVTVHQRVGSLPMVNMRPFLNLAPGKP